MLAMAASPNAWSPVYEAAADTDDSRVPQVAESLLTLIAGITGPSRMFFLILVMRFMIVFLAHSQTGTGTCPARSTS